MNPCEQKAQIRAQVRAALRGLGGEERARAAELLRARLLASALWRSARRVLLFHALPGEPDLNALIGAALAAGKTVALPRHSAQADAYEAAVITDLSQDCVAGRYGVVEPGAHCPRLELNQLDLALVPGLAFDAAGRRLGRGKGYYDRLLARVRGVRCGVAFEAQIVAGLPEEPHDVKLNCLVTPSRWIEFPPVNQR